VKDSGVPGRQLTFIHPKGKTYTLADIVDILNQAFTARNTTWFTATKRSFSCLLTNPLIKRCFPSYRERSAEARQARDRYGHIGVEVLPC